MTVRERPILRAALSAALLLLALEYTANGQPRGSVLETRVDRREIRLGDPAVLSVTVELPDGSVLDASGAWPDSLPRFEWLTPLRADTAVADGGWRITFSRGFTSFDSGLWTFPSMAFVVDGRNLRSDTVGMQVGTVPLAGTDYRDIGDILEAGEVEDGRSRLPYAIAALLTMGLAAWLYLRSRRRDDGPSAASPAPDDAYERAMKELDALIGRDLSGVDAVRGFHHSLYEVLRAYLEKGHGWRVSSLTTGDLLAFLAARCPDRGSVTALADCLRLSDAVRFARHLPSEWDSRRCVSDVRSFIRCIHETPRNP